MALISLGICAGWSEPFLVTQTTLLEISCHSSLRKMEYLRRQIFAFLPQKHEDKYSRFLIFAVFCTRKIITAS